MHKPLILAVAAVRNRQEKTLRSLMTLGMNTTVIDFVIIDDGSDDGTPEAITKYFPDVHLLYGDGTLYWAGAMALGLRAARARASVDVEGVLLFNDDVEFEPGAIDRMVQLAAATPGSAVVGATLAGRNNSVRTYGGLKRTSRWRPLKLTPVQLSDELIACDTFNGNCVFLPMELWDAVEGIDGYFTHVFGDIDLGLRIKKLGFEILQLNGAVGFCPRDHIRESWMQPGLSLRARWELITGPFGLPLFEYVHLARRHAPWSWPLWILASYGKLFLAALDSATPDRRRWRHR